MISPQDIAAFRDVARRYHACCVTPRQQELRDLWRRHNSLKPTRPLVILKIMGDSFWREIPGLEPSCEDPMLRWQDMYLRRLIWLAELGDDTVLEPSVDEWAVYQFPANGPWGLKLESDRPEQVGGAYKTRPPIQEWADAARLVRPEHKIDEAATAEKIARLREAAGDVIEVKCVRAPYYRGFRGDLSSHLGALRGIDNLMLDMYEHPDELRSVLEFMSEAIVTMHAAGERAGDWRLTDHNNQAIAYAEELPDPGAHERPVPRKQLWGHWAAQELTGVSPAMHDEFMLRYQLPSMKEFGLVAYGCCEDLTQKIDMLRQVPNLRRIAVTPAANLEKCAAQIGTDYVISWRPNPAEMVCGSWQPERVRRIIKRGLEICRGLHVDITLKDVETVGGDPNRLREWVRIVQDCIAEGG